MRKTSAGVSNAIFAYHLGLGGGLEADLASGVLLEAGVEDSVGDLIAELVGVTLTDGLGGEVEQAWLGALHLIQRDFVK